jgi:ribosomal protein S12 methylthiotransferase
MDFVRETEFDRVGVFTYSHEEDTPAFVLEDDVPEAIKAERRDRLMALQMEISKSKNIRKVGKKMRVLIDARYGDEYAARTEYDSPEVDNEVHIITDKILSPGKFIDVEITDADAYDLWAKPLE